MLGGEKGVKVSGSVECNLAGVPPPMSELDHQGAARPVNSPH